MSTLLVVDDDSFQLQAVVMIVKSIVANTL